MEKRARILVADDEEYICRIVVEMLLEEDYQVVSFVDAAKAIDYLTHNTVDLVLTDILMKEHTGLEVLRTATDSNPDAVVILMTANPTVQTAISALRQGAYDFLVKPFKLDLLRATIKRGLTHVEMVQDNLRLRGQVEFLRAANCFLASGMSIDDYLKMVLRCCNTELMADYSAILQVNPRTGDVIKCTSEPGSPPDCITDSGTVQKFLATGYSHAVMTSKQITRNNHEMYEIVVSTPICIRNELHGVINVLCNSRTERIPAGQLGALSILASSAASAMANNQLHLDLKRSYLDAIAGLANAVEARDTYTSGHTDRVKVLAEMIARRLGWDERRIQTLHYGCTLHDIGKIGVPDAILNKPGQLTGDERKQMERHTELGLQVINGIDLFEPIVPYIIAHHERYDGCGYPQGLKGEEIPIEGRLLAVADTFDAIMSDRPYRQGADLKVAVGELLEHRGTQFDPVIVDVFLDILRHNEVHFRELYDRDVDISCLAELYAMETVPVQTK